MISLWWGGNIAVVGVCQVEWFQFSRKNYTYPSFQKDLHKVVPRHEHDIALAPQP